MADPPDPGRALYLVDGSNNLYRAFYAIRGLSTSKGLPTNAIFGFTSMLRKLLREHAPLHLGVAFDLAEPTFRHKAFAAFEADDVIATLADRGRKAGFQVVIVATDKDLLQLVGDGVMVFNPVSEQFLDSGGVERVFGVRPDQVRDVLALCGDSSDNIPGV